MYTISTSTSAQKSDAYQDYTIYTIVLYRYLLATVKSESIRGVFFLRPVYHHRASPRPHKSFRLLSVKYNLWLERTTNFRARARAVGRLMPCGDDTRTNTDTSSNTRNIIMYTKYYASTTKM